MDYTYINSKEYFIAYSLMINAAKHFGFCTYQEIAQSIGLSITGNHMNNVVSSIIGLISENEVKHGRPMLSSVVVNVTGKPGKGFFDWARTLGVLPVGDDEEKFLNNERKKVYDEWRTPYKLSKVNK